jgi:hypothetical protein
MSAKRFLSFLIEQEIQEYGLNLDILTEQFHILAEPKTQVSPKWPVVRAAIDRVFQELERKNEKALREKLKKANEMKSQSLFTKEGSNPKLSKSGKSVPEYYSIGLFLAPSTLSGIDVCPCATDECRAACLGSAAGRARMDSVRDARVVRTQFLFNHPEEFIIKLINEIQKEKEKAEKEGKKLAVRLNGTSDLPWEYIAPKLFDYFPDVTFYDYTKVAGRLHRKERPKNYHLTLSSTGINHPGSNWSECKKHLDNGGVVAMTFRPEDISKPIPKNFDLPEFVVDAKTGKKYRVIDGDKHDHRHLDKVLNDLDDNEGVIAGLRIKGGKGNAETAGNFAVPIPTGKNEVIAKY